MKNRSYSLIVTLFLLVGSFVYTKVEALPIQDFGDPNARILKQQFHAIAQGRRQTPMHIMQLGDSHTAGEYFTGRLRELLQEHYGNAGIGWVTPGYILNQRSNLVSFRNKGIWQLSDSKRITHSGPFPLGGLYNVSNGNAIIEIKLKNPGLPGNWQLSLWQQSAKTPWNLALKDGQFFKFKQDEYPQSTWYLSSLSLDSIADESLFLLAPQNAKLGGIVLDRDAAGLRLDALGINGATAATINRWDASSFTRQMQWRNPELVILAYGTNEAFDADLKQDEYEMELRQAIQKIRNAVPKSTILLIGAPGAAKKKSPNVRGECQLPLPPNLSVVQQSQRRVAEQEKLLYWDWASLMGGNCGVAKWVNRKPALMRPDMIHFSAEGYALSAEILYEALMLFVDDIHDVQSR